MRIKRAHDDDAQIRYRLGDLPQGSVIDFEDGCDGEPSYGLVLDEYFRGYFEDRILGPNTGEAVYRLVTTLNGTADCLFVDEKYPLVDGAFVEGA